MSEDNYKQHIARLDAALKDVVADNTAIYKAKATLIDERDTLRVERDASKAREEAYRADVVQLTAELDRERERCGVLERECEWYRKYQASVDTCDCGSDGCDVCDEAYENWQVARRKTDTRHALDAAKFVGGGSE